tara:strand:- start:579 stop:1196 length:618 start_codon:yes stop_codon:yes gene_type:complete
MYFRFKILLLALLISFSYSDSAINDNDYSNHMELFIHQDIINNFLDAIGSIKGGGKFTDKLKFSYNWSVYDFKVLINKGQSKFYADLDFYSGKFHKKDIITGGVDITYDEEKNLIYVKIIDVYIDVDASEIFDFIPNEFITINIDLSNYFGEPFEIEAPHPKATFYEIPMYDGSTKIINIDNKESKLYLVENGIKIISIYNCSVK